MDIGFSQLVLIVIVALLIFGPKRIPELAKALGKASFEYKKAREAIEKESQDLMKTAENHAKAEDEAEKKKDG